MLIDVTPDIEWLLKQGRQLGVGAKLASKLNYLWRSCTGELSEQNDLFRLTYALERPKICNGITACWATWSGQADMLWRSVTA